MTKHPSPFYWIVWAVVVVATSTLSSNVSATIQIPFVSKIVTKLQHKSSSKSSAYTPLLFFTTPKDIIPECDAMEIVITELEKELNVKVERLDILRNPNAEALLSVLTQKPPPFLYNRESLQIIHVPGAGASSSGNKGSSSDDDSTKANASYIGKINKDRVRAWAKGRYLPSLSASITGDAASPSGGKKPIVVSQEESAIDQLELMEDMMMTPLQKSGKDIIQQTTNQKAKEAKEAKATQAATSSKK